MYYTTNGFKFHPFQPLILSHLSDFPLTLTMTLSQFQVENSPPKNINPETLSRSLVEGHS